MPVNPDVVGKKIESEPYTYNEDSVILYALGIGAGLDNHIVEGTDRAPGDREIHGLDDHLGELLTDDRVFRTEVAVDVSVDDAPGSQITYGVVVGMATGNVGEAVSRQSQRCETNHQGQHHDGPRAQSHCKSPVTSLGGGCRHA